MKLQGLSVIFALIVLPLILILSYYIQLQVDTIALQNEYDKKLLNATYDALSSFEINTANEDLSTVSDSLRTIIEASYNVFINTLSTNLGMSNASKSYVEPYIPAVLYTLYDGYYIYAPTLVPTLLTDSDGVAVFVGGHKVKKVGSYYEYDESLYDPDNNKDQVVLMSDLATDEEKKQYGQFLYLSKDSTSTKNLYTTDINNANLTSKNVLKTYMPYSARYIHGDIDITVVYTLDNFLTVEGSIGNAYFTESGYLLDTTKLSIDGNPDILKYNQSDAETYIKKGGSNVIVKIDDVELKLPTESYNDLTNKLQVADNELKNLQNTLYKLYSVNSTPQSDIDNINSQIANIQNNINDYTYKLQQIDAVVYYVKACIFSNWIESNLIEVRENDIIEISGQEYKTLKTTLENTGYEELVHDFSKSDNRIFITKSGNLNTAIASTEIDEDSTFFTHKMNVIRNSIQYNLNLAMSSYNNNSIYIFDYAMPIIQSNEWDRILSNPSIVSFMQGYSCGLKTYSNYMIATSINNEISVSSENILYINKDEFCDETSEYHKIDCPRFINNDNNENVEGSTDDMQMSSSGVTEIDYIAFTSKDAKYDKQSGTADNASTYYYDHRNLSCNKCIVDGNYVKTKNIFDISNSKYTNIRKAFYQGVGSIRNSLYKMNAFTISEGYEVMADYTSAPGITSGENIDLSKIKSIDLVFNTIAATDRNESTIRFRVCNNGSSTRLNDTIYSIVPNSTSYTSVHVEVNPLLTAADGKVSSTSLYFDCNVLNGGGIPNSTITATKGDVDIINGSEYSQKFNRIFNDSLIYFKINFK